MSIGGAARHGVTCSPNRRAAIIASGPQLTHKRPIWSATCGRCPRCGEGRLFSGYLTVVDRCERCHLKFAAHDSADGPAVLIMLFFGFVVAGLLVVIEMKYAPPFWVHALIWPPFILAGALALMRPLKGTFIGIQFKYRSVEEDVPDDRF